MATTVRVYSDFVCPFCFVAEQSGIEQLLRDYDVTLEWHGFELHPETPAKGIPLTELMRGATAESLSATVKQLAHQYGVKDVQPRDWLPNTRKAMALVSYADEQGKGDAVRRLVMEAHWRQGRDIGDDAVLRDLAVQAGLDGEVALREVSAPARQERVASSREQAIDAGVTGVPAVYIGDQLVMGCQPYDVFKIAADNAGLQPRST